MVGSLGAHVKWFVDPRAYPTDYSLLLSAPVLAAFAAAGLAIAVAAVLQARLREPRAFAVLERFAGYAPLALGLHLGVALLVAAALGLLFVPALRVVPDGLGSGILAVEAVCGLLLAVGLGTRVAALALALLGVVAMQPFTFESILEQVHILGAAVFLFICGRGQLSLDRLFGFHRSIPHELAPEVALGLVRIAMGTGIAFGALTEKLLNPALANALLRERPELNALAALGVGDAQFAYLAGLVELVIGAVVVSGRLTRPVVAVGAVLFTVSLPLFGWSELLGHLPYYGIMLVLFVAPSAGPRRVRERLREGRLAA